MQDLPMIDPFSVTKLKPCWLASDIITQQREKCDKCQHKLIRCINSNCNYSHKKHHNTNQADEFLLVAFMRICSLASMEMYWNAHKNTLRPKHRRLSCAWCYLDCCQLVYNFHWCYYVLAFFRFILSTFNFALSLLLVTFFNASLLLTGWHFYSSVFFLAIQFNSTTAATKRSTEQHKPAECAVLFLSSTTLA